MAGYPPWPWQPLGTMAETSGPDLLTVDFIPDGTFLQRQGNYIEGVALPIVGPSNCVFLSTTGFDAGPNIGIRGNAARPFQTFQAALNAAVAGDTLCIAGGTYQSFGAIVWPAGLTALTILGTGAGLGAGVTAGDTLIEVLGASVITGLPAGMTYLALINVHLKSTTTGITLNATGGAGGTFLTDGLFLQNVVLESVAGFRALNVTYANHLGISNVAVGGAGATITTSRLDWCVGFTGTSTTSALNYAWDETDAFKPVIGRNSAVLRATHFQAGLTVAKQPDLRVERGCSFSSITGSGLTDSLGAVQPRLGIHCRFTATAGISVVTTPDSVAAGFYDFTDMEMESAGWTLQIGRAGVVNGRSTVRMDGLTCPVGAGVTANAGTDISCRTECKPTFSTPTTGTITPAQLTVLGVAAIADTTIPFTFTAGSTLYQVSAIGTSALATPLTQGAKNTTNTHVAVGGVPGGTLDVTVTWQ
jgi:hypothetical protein